MGVCRWVGRELFFFPHAHELVILEAFVMIEYNLRGMVRI